MFYKLKSFLLTILGNIKIYKFPFFFIYDATSFKVKGTDTIDIMSVIKRGDLILRKYNNYLDGYFIPGEYSHTGVYIGDNTVIHAIAEGVTKINIVDFTRCDKCVVLRPSAGVDSAIERLQHWADEKVQCDFDFKSNNKALYCHEVGAEAYKELDIKKIIPSLLGIKGTPTYLAESFLESSDFEIIIEK